jgi:hypothetical protein
VRRFPAIPYKLATLRWNAAGRSWTAHQEALRHGLNSAICSSFLGSRALLSRQHRQASPPARSRGFRQFPNGMPGRQWRPPMVFDAIAI